MPAVFKHEVDKNGLASALDAASKRLFADFLAYRSDVVTAGWLEVMEYFNRTIYGGFSSADRRALSGFLLRLLTVVADESYSISHAFLGSVVGANPVLANLLAVTPIQDTEPYLRIVVRQQNNFLKICLLWNARVVIKMNTTRLFDADPVVASAWFSGYCYSAWGVPTVAMLNEVRRQIREIDPRLRYVGETSIEPYFSASYFEPEFDRQVKVALNASIQKMFAAVRVTNRPQRGRVAIISQRWKPGTAVYKILRHFVAALKPSCHLTLVHLGAEEVNAIAADPFDRVFHVRLRDTKLDLREIESNDFELVFFPDIGMSVESMLLSNLRLAPIQCSSYGHSVSTWGSRVDYWIGGRDAEPDRPEENYSERLILLPGSGGPPIIPDYCPNFPAKSGERVIVNCPCGAYKLNAEYLADICEIAGRVKVAGKKMHCRFFASGTGGRMARRAAIVKDLKEIFSSAATFEIFDELPYVEYMAKVEECHLALDAYPFGGCNSIMDVLWVHQPVVTRYGNEWNNRYGMALLKRLGLEEMAVSTREEYIELGTRLVVDDAYRAELERKIAAVDLVNQCWDPSEAQAFKRAIDYLIANHERLKQENSRAPIYID